MSNLKTGLAGKINQEHKALIAEQLINLEEDLRRLKIEFDVFLNGGAKRPPYDTKNRVDTMLKRLADDRAMPYAQRYLYNSLLGRYTAFQGLWRRSMKAREEGTGHHLPRHKVMAYTGQQSPPTSFRCSDVARQGSEIKAMYEAFVTAKRQCGENPEEVSYDFFHQVVAHKTQSLRERYQCEQVRFSVQIEAGKVNFIAQAETSETGKTPTQA